MAGKADGLIQAYRLEVFTPPCSPGAERFAALVHLEADIGEALPYLNATLPGARYNPAAPALTWQQGPRRVTFWPRQIAVGGLEDRAEAERVAADLVALVNRTWQRRAAITPDRTAHERPTPMQVYQALPGTNCRACGQPTCFTFALKLIAGQATLAQCPPLAAAEYAAQRAQLEAMLPGG